MLTSWMVLICVVLIHWAQADSYGHRADVRYVIPLKIHKDNRFRTGFLAGNLLVSALRVKEEESIGSGPIRLMNTTIYYDKVRHRDFSKTIELLTDVNAKSRATMALFRYVPLINKLQEDLLVKVPPPTTSHVDHYIALRLYSIRTYKREANQKKGRDARREFYFLYGDCHKTADQYAGSDTIVIECPNYKGKTLDYGAPIMGVNEDRSHDFVGIVTEVYEANMGPDHPRDIHHFFVKNLIVELIMSPYYLSTGTTAYPIYRRDD